MGIESAIVLDDRYRLLDELGHAGMSDVYRAFDEVLKREVAVKILREVEDPGLRARFVAEAELLAGLNHPGPGDPSGCRHPFGQAVPRDDLDRGADPERAAQGGALPPHEVAAIGTQIAAALACSHQQGVTHRDVEPSNVQLCAGARALLADFGIARLTGDVEQHTRAGGAIGSPAYLTRTGRR